jgi:peptidyl-prolyl cis-trans isomerase D
MFDFVRTHNRLLFLVMVLLIFPSFVFFGIQDYRGSSDGAGATVARVDGRKVTRVELEAFQKQQLDQLMKQMPGLDPKLLETPEMKKQALDRLVRERVLYASAQQQRLTVTDDRLQRELLRIPQLAQLKAPDGSIDIGAYKALLQSAGMTPESFEASVRQGALLNQPLAGAAGPVPTSSAAANAALQALLQQREIQTQVFDPKAYAAKVAPTDDDLQAHYKAHEAEYRTVEEAVIEYVSLDLEALERGVTVSKDDAQKFYEQNVSRFTAAEERQAAHILVAADKAGPAEQRSAAKAAADKILAEVRKAPDQFAAIAKKQSQDPGSAEQGGDLGFQRREAWVKPFADAVFAMKPGEISDVVETDFGYHVIRLQATRGGERKPFAEAQAQVEKEIKTAQAQKLYTESVDAFGNTAYEQSDSLQPLAEKFKLTKQTATVRRAPTPGAAAPLDSPKLLDAVFSDDVLEKKRNSQALETGRNRMTVARLVEHKPAKLRPFDEVKAQVREAVVADKASALARKDGKARVDQLKGGGDATGLGAAATVSRVKPDKQPPEVVSAAMAAPAPLPQYIGVETADGGYTVVRVVKSSPPPADSPELAQMTPRYAQAWSEAQAQAYYKALEKRVGVEILVDPTRVVVDAAK